MKYTAAFLLVLTLAGCAPKTITTAPGQIAFTADQVVVRVNELQNAAIQANTNKALDDATTRVIVNWAIAADTTLKTTPSGWQATLKSGWLAVKPQIPVNNPTLAITVGAVDALIGGL